ncbi:MAG: hypothetical protein ACREQD_03515, partial [Candidatus Binataceae bacterium]
MKLKAPFYRYLGARLGIAEPIPPSPTSFAQPSETKPLARVSAPVTDSNKKIPISLLVAVERRASRAAAT